MTRKRIRITDCGDPRHGYCRIEVVDADGAVMENLSSRCYGYEMSRRAHEHARLTLFCVAESNITADADIVEVPRSLQKRAKELADRIGNPAVTAAFGELLGVSLVESVKPDVPADALRGIDKVLRELSDGPQVSGI